MGELHYTGMNPALLPLSTAEMNRSARAPLFGLRLVWFYSWTDPPSTAENQPGKY